MRSVHRTFALLFALGLASCQTAKPSMRLHFVDVGQGDATLIELPCAAVLVDTGGEQNPSFSSNEHLGAYLDRFFAERPELGGRLELLVLTHPHVDHTRGTKLVLERHTPRHIVTNGLERGSGRHGQLAAHRYAEGDGETPARARLQRVRAGQIPPGGLTNEVIDPIECDSVDPELRVLWGALDEEQAGQNGNNHSVVLHLRFGLASVLFTGDLETESIEALLTRHVGHDVLRADVYQVGHHGSHNATTEALVQAMKPKLAVISMGRPDREHRWTAWAYGHPSAKVVALLSPRLSKSSKARTVRVGHGARRFEEETVDRALYATGWDGDVVLEATLDGTWTVVRP